MPPPWPSDEPADEEWGDDPDAPQERDLVDPDDETSTVPCPSCGQPVAEIAERCPHCSDWIVPGGRQSGGSRGWMVIAAILALAAMLVWQLL